MYKFYAMSVLEEIPQNSAFVAPVKPESSGFEMEANMDFQDKNVYSRCSSINKQGTYLQVHYREK